MKQPKASVDYSPGHKESHCGPVSADDKGYCRNFRKLQLAPRPQSWSSGGSCVKVIGGIKRMYWCKLFEKAQ